MHWGGPGRAAGAPGSLQSAASCSATVSKQVCDWPSKSRVLVSYSPLGSPLVFKLAEGTPLPLSDLRAGVPNMDLPPITPQGGALGL